jgi:hypothetical protein
MVLSPALAFQARAAEISRSSRRDFLTSTPKAALEVIASGDERKSQAQR